MNTSSSENHYNGLEIAIIGLACRFPGARSPEEFWQNIQDGVESLTCFSDDELASSGIDAELLADPNYVKVRGTLENIEYFDAAFFGYTPREAEVMDPQCRLFLECAWEALERAGYDPETYQGLIGVYAGSAWNSYLISNIVPHYDPATLQGSAPIMFGNDKEYLTTRVSYKLNLKGPSVNIQSACSTSLVAVHQACQSLLSGECDMALAGGVSIGVPQVRGYLYQEEGIASPDGHCRAFDAQAQGTTFSNGLGIVVLKRLTDAIASGDDIIAVIKGAALNNDGSSKVSFMAPGVEGQARVIRAAQQMAEVDARSISYIETHGTGTPLGDPIEIAALTQAFRETSDSTGFCSIGSVKTNIGHVNTASGVAGLIKTALALKHRQLPPSLHFQQPNPRIDFADSPFYVNTTLTPWISPEKMPRRAGVSSFGVGGTNAHVVMEEAPSRPQGSTGRSWQLLPLSARTDAALEAALDNLSAYLRRHPDESLADVAYTLQAGRKAFQQRCTILCNDHNTAIREIEQRKLLKAKGAVKQRFVIFLFPGQGTQYVHMAEELYREEALFRQQIDLCAEILLPHLKLDLREILFAREQEGAEERLNQTALAQPALFAIEYALSQLWMAWGVIPQAMIGHSIGEYVAACIAGVFSLEDALALVAERGRLMQMMPPGTMLAVPLSEEETRKLLGDRLSIAAINGPARCVVSGAEEDIGAFERRLGEQGLPCKRLHTSHAFHSDMMTPVVEPLMACLRTKRLHSPTIPYISNLTGTWITEAETTDPSYWAQHLLHTVRFCEGIKTLAQKPDALFLEVGPGQTLGTLTLPLLNPDSRVPVYASMRHIRESCSDLEAMMKAVAQCWLAGVCIDWEQFHAGENRRRITLPTYPFERKKFWIAPPSPARQPRSAAIDETQKNVSGTFSRSNENGEEIKERAMPDLHATLPCVAPRHDRIVERLRTVFSQLLGLEAQNIDPQATFLEMGADSLLLLQANQAIREELHVTVPFRLMFDDYPTIDDLAAFVDEKLPSDALPVPQEGEALPEPAHSPSAQNMPVAGAVAPPQLAQITPAASMVVPSQSLQAAPGASIEHLLQQQLLVMSQQLDILRTGYTVTGPAGGETKALQSPRPPAPDPLPVPVRERNTEPLAPAKTAPASSEGLRFSKQIKQETFVPYRPRQKRAASDLSEAQQEHLNALIARYCAKTKESKRLAQTYRPFLADNKGVTGFRLPLKEMQYPLAVERAQGARIWDVDGNEYVDTAMGYGTLLFGHNPAFITETIAEQIKRGIRIGPQSPIAGKVAQLLCEVTHKERATFCNSGTEAVMTALRIARAATGKPKVALFAGSYHGSFDGILVVPRNGTNKDGLAAPMAPGVPPHIVDDVMILHFDTPEALETIKAHAHELAAVLVEPRQSRRPDLQPVAFLQELRQLTLDEGIALIFDEVVTGFRTHLGGVQGMLGIQADITTYGKALGGGIPISAIAGKASFMDVIDGGTWSYGDGSYPETTETFFAGTFFKHPLVMPVVWSVLNYLKEQSPVLQERLNRYTDTLTSALNTYFEQQQIPMLMVNFGSLFRFVFPPELKGMTSDVFFYHLIEKGVYLSEGRNCFISTAHTEEDMHFIIRAVKESIVEMQAGGFLVDPSLTPPTPDDDGVKISRRSQLDKKSMANQVTASVSVAARNRATPPASAVAGEKNKRQRVPLTDAQKELWFQSQMGDDASRAYNESIALQMDGPLNRQALERALQELVNRHESLRTTFSIHGEYQEIASTLPIKIIYTKAGDLDHAEEARKEWRKGVVQQVFDLEKGPLLRAYLMTIEEERSLLVLVYHHIIVDGWSVSTLLEELSALYSAFCQGKAYQLPEPVQYREYVEMQNRKQEGSEMLAAERYWVEQLAGLPPFLELPTDTPRPAVKTYNGAYYHTKIEPLLSKRLKKVGAQHNCTLFTMLLASFETLLHRLTGQDDIVVGIPAAGQMSVGNRPLVGHCVNLLPLRSQINGDTTFSEHLTSVKRVLLDAYEHQIYPFIRLVKTLNLPRDPARSPLISVLFNLDRPVGSGGLEFWNLTINGVTEPADTAKVDLFLNLAETEDGIQVDCNYNTDLLSAKTVQRWMEYWRTLLEHVAENPRQRLAELDLLTEAARHQLLVAWNNTATDRSSETCLHYLFQAQAEQTPDAPALIFENTSLTYRELDLKSNQLAHALQARGVGVETLVGICAERSLEMVIGILGILKAGGAYVPLDPTYPRERLAFLLKDTHVPVLLTQQHLLSRLPSISTDIVCLDRDWETIAQESTASVGEVAGAENLIYVIYTSGSSGTPKGVMNCHSALSNRIAWMQKAYGLTSADRVLQKTPFSFDVSVWEFFWPLVTGATLVIARPEGHKDSAYLIELIRRQKITTLHFVPSMLQIFLQDEQVSTCTSLRRVFCSGEALLPHHQQRFFELLHANLYNLYGPTEAAIDVTAWTCQPDRHGPVVPIGYPIDNTQIYILDTSLQPVPVGIPGELHIGGAGLARGYLNRPDLTRERFIEHSLCPGGRLYKTGDLARYRPDGCIEYLGRLDNQVKLHGFRIELGEIEALLHQHPALSDAVVLLHEDTPENKQLVAYVVPAARQVPVSAKELRAYLTERLPMYMVPATFLFLEKSLPLSPNGKVDRRALPAPERSRSSVEETFIAPSTAIMQLLASSWSQVLRIEKIGIHDNFFALGGDSILGMQIIARLNQAGLRLTPRQLFQYQTIAELATVVEQSSGVQIEQGEGTGEVSLTPIQHWFLEQKLPNPQHFNLALLLEVRKPVDPVLLEECVRRLLIHHDALRMRFVHHEDRWQQVIREPDRSTPFTYMDLSAVSEDEQQRLIESAAASLQASLDTFNGPLMQVVLFDRGADKSGRLLLIIHHIAVDIVSWRILLDDLQTAYGQLQHGEEVQLPAKTTSVKRWSTLLTHYAQSAQLQQEKAYWLSDARERIAPLPVDNASGANTEGSVHVVTMALTAQETRTLLREVPKIYRSQINDALLSALAQACGQWTGERTVLFDLEGHGREDILEDVDLSRTVGWFTSIAPILLEMDPAHDPGQALQSCKEQLRRLPHGGIGYGLLRYLCNDAGTAAKLASLPQAQMSFNYLGRSAQALPEDALFAATQESYGPTRDPRAPRRYLIDVVAVVAHDQLHVSWIYSKEVFELTTIESVARSYISALRALIAHCQSSDAGALTPVDFLLTRLDQQKLNKVLAKARFGK